MRTTFVALLLVLVLGTLAACGTTSTQVQPAANTPAAASAATEVPTEAPSSAPAEAAKAGVEKTIYVAAETVPCVGVAPQDCLQIKESPDAEWQRFYDQIEGFTFEPGFEYELRVREEQVANPPADASSRRLVLLEEVSRTAVKGISGGAPQEPLGATAENPLAGTAWQIVTLNGAAPADGTQVTLAFNAQDRYSANAGCNTINGGYTVDGETITFGSAMSTLMLCPKPIMQQEEQFKQALEAATSFTLEDDTLTIVYGAGEALVFTAQAASSGDAPATGGDQRPPLVGSDWVLTAFNEGGTATSVVANTTPSLSFAIGDQFRGSTGCNTMSGSYTLAGDVLTLEVGPLTRRACPPPISEQETRFLAALAQVSRFEQTDTTLILFYGSDGQLIFQPITPIDQAEPSGPTTEQSLSDTAWELISFTELDAARPLVDDTTITLTFGADGKVNGNAGCNVFNGSYAVDGVGLQFGAGFATTKMACPPPVMDQEQEFLAALAAATTYERNGNVLIIYYGDGSQSLAFQMVGTSDTSEERGTMSEPNENALAGTAWKLTALVADGTTTDVVTLDGVPARKAGLAFREDGRASGSGGCNVINAGYTVEGETITFGPVMSTMMACPDPLMKQEFAFTKALEAAASFTIDGDTLTISSADGATALIFERTASAE